MFWKHASTPAGRFCEREKQRPVWKRHRREIEFSLIIIAIVGGIGAAIVSHFVFGAALLAKFSWSGTNFRLKQPAENVCSVEFGRLEQSGEELPVFIPDRVLSEDKLSAFLQEAEAVEYNYTLSGGHSVYECELNETVVIITFADGAYHYLHSGGSAYISADGKFKERNEYTGHNGFDAMMEEYAPNLLSNGYFHQEE